MICQNSNTFQSDKKYQNGECNYKKLGTGFSKNYTAISNKYMIKKLTFEKNYLKKSCSCNTLQNSNYSIS